MVFNEEGGGVSATIDAAPPPALAASGGEGTGFARKPPALGAGFGLGGSPGVAVSGTRK